MLFSERHGHKKIPLLKKNEMPGHLRTRIWNVFHEFIFRNAEREVEDFYSDYHLKFTRVLWDKFFKGDLWDFDRMGSVYRIVKIRERYEILQWYEVYDFIEFILTNVKDKDTLYLTSARIEKVLEEEKTQFRILNNCWIVPLTSEEEIKEIEKTLSIPEKYKPVSDHASKALEFYSKRPEAEYRNSISESIKAVESLVQIVLGEKGTLSELINELNIHQAMKVGFKKLYNWTSDDSGIRHGEYGESFPCGEPEATYMLVSSSAFINYLITKLDVVIGNG